jgi:hypothetical protein
MTWNSRFPATCCYPDPLLLPKYGKNEEIFIKKGIGKGRVRQDSRNTREIAA